jgi:hypothetical protein
VNDLALFFFIIIFFSKTVLQLLIARELFSCIVPCDVSVSLKAFSFLYGKLEEANQLPKV